VFHSLVQKVAKGGGEGIKKAFKEVASKLGSQDIKALKGNITQPIDDDFESSFGNFDQSMPFESAPPKADFQSLVNSVIKRLNNRDDKEFHFDYQGLIA